MRYPSHSGKLKLTSTLLALGLLTGAIALSIPVATRAQDRATEALPGALQPEQFYPSGAIAQTTPTTTAQPRLKVEGRLDEKSSAFENGNRYNLHTFVGKARDQLTIEVSSQEFEAFLGLVGVDQTLLAQENDRLNSNDARLLVTLPATGTYTVVVSSATPKAIGQYRLQVRVTTPDDVALVEAKRLNQQVRQLFQQGKVNEAMSLAQKALAMREKVLGKNHSLVAVSLGNLALLYSAQGRYGEAEPLYQRSLWIYETELGRNDPLVATSLYSLANLYQKQGRYEKAEPLYQRSLQIAETRQGKDNPDVARSLNSLAALYAQQGRYGEAEPLYQRSLQIVETSLGKDHPDVAARLHNLANLYQEQGRYGEAEPLYQRSLQIVETSLGKDHPDVAHSLNGLAALYVRQGRYQEAEPLYQRSLQIRETQLGKDHPDLAASLHNLANLYHNQRRYGEAEPLYQRSLQIFETRLGKNHPNVATSLNNLASHYHEQERYGEAEPLYQRSLQIRETRLGKGHPDVATSLNNLAVLYDNQGRYGQAEPLYQRSLQIMETGLGKDHPNLASNFNNLAGLYTSQREPRRAIAFLTQGLQIEARNLDLNLVIGSGAQKRDYIATLSGTTNQAISLHLQTAPTNLEASQLALTAILQRKGRILDALSDNLNRLRQNLTPADQQQLDRLADLRTQLATLYYGGLGNRSPEQYRAQIDSLKQQTTQLEADLNRRSAEFRTANQPITLSAVQAQIPADAALVELVLYRPFNPKAKRNETWGKRSYAAYILTAAGTIQAVDLGEAAPLDQLAEDFRVALRNRESNVKEIARKLDTVLMQPIRQKLDSILPSRQGGNTRNLLISPDSQLNLIPFAALVDEQNRYLVETYSINYLTSGRDLLRLQNPVASRQPPVLIANPDYANPGNPQAVAQLPKANPVAIAASNSPRPGLGEGQGVRATSQRSSDLARLRFNPLPGTAAEADAIASLLHKVQNAPKLPGVTLLTGTNATENVLKQVQSPKILHIATHGFFLEDIPLVAPDSRGSGSLFRSDVIPEVAPGFRPPTRLGNTENALLRSGLALAGFNPRQSGNEDGVLTALEAAGLNLRGTQLVVLSACETGIGDVTNGEGVYGLRRAFVLAGAESQLISLWKVDDNGTKDLMVKYYDKLLAKAGRSEALRQTQLEFLKHPNYNHPYYWAAFIPSGNWRPLRD